MTQPKPYLALPDDDSRDNQGPFLPLRLAFDFPWRRTGRLGPIPSGSIGRLNIGPIFWAQMVCLWLILLCQWKMDQFCKNSWAESIFQSINAQCTCFIINMHKVLRPTMPAANWVHRLQSINIFFHIDNNEKQREMTLPLHKSKYEKMCKIVTFSRMLFQNETAD